MESPPGKKDPAKAEEIFNKKDKDGDGKSLSARGVQGRRRQEEDK